MLSYQESQVDLKAMESWGRLSRTLLQDRALTARLGEVQEAGDVLQ
jgi:hypothetical protein